MDKNIIKNHLIKRFISEEATPGISVTDKVKKESGKINKAGVAAVGKDVSSYEKSLKKEDPNMNKMAANKYNYTDDAEKTYHEEMEILNGQEMIEYTSEPGAEFKKRAEESLEGSSRMGNAIGANAEETWGASKDSFGKDLVKRIKDSSKKRAEAEIQTYGMGDVQIPTGNKVQTATTAMGAGKPKGDTTKAMQSASDKTKIKTVKENKNNDSEDFEKASREVEYGINPHSKEDEKSEEKKDNNNTTKIKESMKRLKFNKNGDKPFEGVNLTQKLGHALTLIPEGYKIDNKEFEMTDGNVNCKVRWEGTLNEGKAVILVASDKTLVTEDMARMKQLMGYKSQDTLGTVRGNARLDENAAFADIWKKSRKLLGESEDIEDADAVEGDLDDAVGVAKEATKHIEGSVATDKKTEVPKPKTGSADSIDKVVKHAPEAKKHVEGSVATEKKTNAPAPKEGNWEEISVPQAADAKKHIESGTPTHKATDTAKVVKEEKKKGLKLGENYFEPISEEVEEPEAEEDDNTPEPEDTYNKPSTDDDSFDEKEPTANDIKSEVPPAIASDDDDVAVPAPVGGKVGPKLFKNPTTNEYFLLQNGKHMMKDEMGQPIPVPAQYVELAKKNPIAVITKMEDEAEFGGNEEDLDEYGNEHPIATTDAVKSIKPNTGMEEGMFSKSPEEQKAIGMKAISMHPVKKKTYADLLAKDPAMAEKYVMFVGKNPEAKYIGWDKAKNDFTLTGNYSVASGEGTSGK